VIRWTTPVSRKRFTYQTEHVRTTKLKKGRSYRSSYLKKVPVHIVRMSLTEMHFKCGYWNFSMSFVSGLLVGILVGCQFPGWVGYETTSLLEMLTASFLLWYYGPIQALTDSALLFSSSTVVCRFSAWFFMGMASSAPHSKCQPGALGVPLFFLEPSLKPWFGLGGPTSS
jgi:hypothetical protein